MCSFSAFTFMLRLALEPFTWWTGQQWLQRVRIIPIVVQSLPLKPHCSHTFWDCETWMYPTLLLLHPDIAASLLEYRSNHRAGAFEKARSYNSNYSGTMFPW